MKTVVLAMFIITTLFIGCTEENTNPASSLPAVEYTLSISGLPDDLTAVEGSESQLVFTAFVFDQNGRAATGVNVDLSLAMGEGSISPAQAVTGLDGSVEAVCTALVPQGNSTMQVRAVAGGSVVTQSVNLYGFNRPAALQFFPETDRLSVLPNQNGEILLTAIVTDEDGVGIEGVELGMVLHPGEPGGQIFGSISRPEPTDSRGQTTAIFNSGGGSGGIIVRCQVEGLTEGDSALFRNVMLDIELLTIELRNVDLSVNPSYFCIHPDSLAEATVYARTVDVNNVAVPNLRVQMSSDLGVLSMPTLTDSNGLAVARFSNNHEFGVATVSAWVNDPDRSVSATVRIEPLYGENPVLTLTTNRNYIYADNGRTVANIRASLKDEDGHVIPGAQIRFASDFGIVTPATAITDSMGFVQAVFTDVGLPSVDEDGNSVPARITATHSASGAQETVEVTILEQNPVDRITLFTAEDRVQAGSPDSIWIGATCFLANEDFAPEGVMVYFEVDLGSFTSNGSEVNNNFGQAEIYYIPGNLVGTATLRAYVINPDSSIVYSNELEIQIVAGPPARGVLTAEPDHLEVNEPGSYSVITVTILDEYGNPVPGIHVSFSTTLGSLNHLSATTDNRGQATVRLYAGNVTGVAEVTATVNTPDGPITAQICGRKFGQYALDSTVPDAERTRTAGGL